MTVTAFIYGGQYFKLKTYGLDFLISVVCLRILEKSLLKLSLDNEDNVMVMEGPASSCNWIEFLCFRSGFAHLFMNPHTSTLIQSIPHSKAAVCKLLFSWDQQGCFPQCLLRTQRHRSLSSWIWDRAGTAAWPTLHPHNGLPAGHPLWLLSSCPPRRAFFLIWLGAWRLPQLRHRSLG